MCYNVHDVVNLDWMVKRMCKMVAKIEELVLSDEMFLLNPTNQKTLISVGFKRISFCVGIGHSFLRN